MTTTQYMELVNPAKNQRKFWEITAPYSSLQRGQREPTFPGYKVICRWGRIGANGQSKNFYFDALQDAEAFVDSKLREKQREGYTTISRGAVPSLVPAAVQPDPAAHAPIPGAACAACGAQGVRDGGGRSDGNSQRDAACCKAALIEGDAVHLCEKCWKAPWRTVRKQILARRALALGQYVPIAGAICECCGAGATTFGTSHYASLTEPPARLCRKCWIMSASRGEAARRVASKIEHNRRTGELGDRLLLKTQHPNPQDLPDDPFVIPE